MTIDKAQKGRNFDRDPTACQITEARGHLLSLFQDFDALVEEYPSTFMHRSPLTSMAIDDQALKPYLMTTEVQYALSSCIDHLQTVRNLTAADLVPNLATYTLIRSAIEHASLAMWFLDPDDQNERRKRVLVQAATGAKLVENALEGIENAVTISFDAKLLKINEVAASLGLDIITKSDIRSSGIKSRVTWSGMVLQTLGVGTDGSNLISTVWQSASGIAHANSSAALMLLNRRALVDHEDTQSTTFHISTSEVEISRIFQLSIYLLAAVLHLAKHRAGLEMAKYPSFGMGL